MYGPVKKLVAHQALMTCSDAVAHFTFVAVQWLFIIATGSEQHYLCYCALSHPFHGSQAADDTAVNQ